MQTSLKAPNQEQTALIRHALDVNILSLLAVAVTMMLTGCGGTSSVAPQQSASLSGNWQFAMTPPPDQSFSGGLLGGFLLQKSNSLSGAAVYSVVTSTAGVCNSGSAPITGSQSDQTVTLTAVAGPQTLTLTGALSSDGTTIMGTYTSTAGTAPDGSPCGTAQSGLQWHASAVPPITGPVQGSFHSAGGVAGLSNQDFAVSGSLTQGANVGASSATVTGSLTFIDASTKVSDYPCFGSASVNGEISGNNVTLEIIGFNGSSWGQIGGVQGSGLNAVTFNSAQGGGNVLQNNASPGYAVSTKACPGAGPGVQAGDFGNLCLSLGSTSACQQPITLSPAAITFPAQLLGSPATQQTVTLTNNSSSTLSPVTLTFLNIATNVFPGQSDFTGLPSFTETDSCGASFSLASGQSCTITVSFNPQESCPWLPFPNPPSISGAVPQWCPFPQSAQVIVRSPSSADGDTTFTVPVTGLGVSAIQPSTAELDFSAEEALSPPESSSPQTVTFTNDGAGAVQILPLSSAPCASPLIRPLNSASGVSGLQVVGSSPGVVNNITPNGNTITYQCDSDPATNLPNFRISADTCSGVLLAPQAACGIQVTYMPQPQTDLGNGLDYYLELNTLQCTDTITSNCEIDSGRFPVELKANSPSPLRLSPRAGLDFGLQPVGKLSVPLTVILQNDPNLAKPQPVTFIGKIAVSGDYSEIDDCPVILSPGSSCTITVSFKPSAVGFLPGALTIHYSPEVSGLPQFIYLRGLGQ